MRSDMNKLLCERERRGAKGTSKNTKRKGRLPRDVELLPAREKMVDNRNSGLMQRSFNENLNPLYGFVRKSAGRPWDKVYSEICKTFDKRTVINQHILDHLFQYVETKAQFINGKVVVFNAHSWPSSGYRDVKETSCDYYVHPTTGLLLKNSKKSTKKAITAKRKVAIEKIYKDNLRQINQCTWAVRDPIKDVWFKYTAKKKPDPVKNVVIDDSGEAHITYSNPWYVEVSLPNTVGYKDRYVEYKGRYDTKGIDLPGFNHSTHYLAEKKQLSHKEKKQYGII